MKNGTIPPCVGSGRKKEKEKLIERKHGDTSTKGVEATHGPFIRSTRNHSETTFALTGDTEDDEYKKRDWLPLLKGAKKPTAAECEYNCFTIKPFHLCILCTAPFHHVNMGVYYLQHFTIFVLP